MPMSVGIGIGTGGLPAIPGFARAVETRGYDMVTAPETQHDPFLPLVLVAEHTEHIKLGTSVAIAFPRSPHMTANAAWDLASFSGGRFVLGLGTQVKGHNERRFSTPWGPPGPRLRDYIACIRAIWDCWQSGTRPNYDGEYYQFKLTNSLFNPGPIEYPNIRIAISAVNPYNCRLAGEICDGVYLHPLSSFRYTREIVIPALEEGARRAGKTTSDLEIRGGGFLATGRNEEEVAHAKENVRRQISFYASTRSYSRVMNMYGWDDEAAQLHRLSIEGRWDDMVSIITDDMLDEFAVVGTWQELPTKIREKCSGIKTQITLGVEPQNPDEEAQVKEILTKLKEIPAFGEA